MSLKFQARVGDRIYIVGGIDDSNNPQGETWYAQKGGTRWNILDNTLRKPRHKLACVEHKGKLWAIGGAEPKLRPENIDPVKDVEILDPVTEKWSLATELPIPLMEHHVISYNGDLWCLGGFTRAPLYTDTRIHYKNDKGPLILIN